MQPEGINDSDPNKRIQIKTCFLRPEKGLGGVIRTHDSDPTNHVFFLGAEKGGGRVIRIHDSAPNNHAFFPVAEKGRGGVGGGAKGESAD